MFVFYFVNFNHTSPYLFAGVGKTTVIKKVCEELKKKNLKIDGFFTEEVRSGRDRIGFDVVTMSGKRDILARARFISFVNLVIQSSL